MGRVDCFRVVVCAACGSLSWDTLLWPFLWRGGVWSLVFSDGSHHNFVSFSEGNWIRKALNVCALQKESGKEKTRTSTATTPHPTGNLAGQATTACCLLQYTPRRPGETMAATQPAGSNSKSAGPKFGRIWPDSGLFATPPLLSPSLRPLELWSFGGEHRENIATNFSQTSWPH